MTPALAPRLHEQPLSQLMLSEFRKEAAITRRVLERVPADKLSWQPHAKSMSVGQLALHIASIPGNIPKLAQVDEFDVSTFNFNFPPANNREEILAAFDAGCKTTEAYLGSLNDSGIEGSWRMTAGPQEIFNITRFDLLRTILLNHWYHHRGQLSVYLRLLDIPVPSIYGPSADERPFG